jgi:hypothetical protein
MSIYLRRRDFIAALGGAAAWPLAARGQQGERMRRIGVLIPDDENDPVAKAYLSAFTQALAGLGWADGRNVRMDLRWHGGDINRIRAFAQELVGLQPDIIVTASTPPTAALQRETRAIPIVFASVVDPLANGIVARLDRPGGNITGFGALEATLGGKWLELLSEIAPGLKRAAIMFGADLPLEAIVGSRLRLALDRGQETLAGGNLDSKQFNDYVTADPLTKYFRRPATVWTARVQKDGSDSIGILGALNRVYLNIGLFSEEWLLHFNAVMGGKAASPIRLRIVRENSAYWRATACSSSCTNTEEPIMNKATTKEVRALLETASEMFDETGCVPGIDGEEVRAETMVSYSRRA